MLINASPGLAKYTEMKYQMESALIITHIFPESQAQRSRSLSPGSIIKEVNGQSVKTMSELRESLFKGLQSGNLTVETADGVFVVCPFKKILTEDQQLAKDFFIPISDTQQTLLVKADINKKQEGPVLVNNLELPKKVKEVVAAAA